MRIIPRMVEGLRRAADTLEAAGQANGTGKPAGVQKVLDEYVTGLPSAQHAIDALPGWNQALPPHLGVTAGQGAFYADPRILWAIEQMGGVAGRTVLELGPLEASHTWLLEQHGPASIDAIEANKLSFLRCLVVKELLGLRTARFHLGDFVEYLDRTEVRYDVIVASGVLYHMQDPVHLIRAMARRSDALYLWTHYASDLAMPEKDPRRGAMVGEVEVHDVEGLPVRLHKRSYMGAWKSKSFCGGMHDIHRWIERDDILALLGHLGFTDVRVAHDEPAHLYGPSFSVFARRPAAA